MNAKSFVSRLHRPQSNCKLEVQKAHAHLLKLGIRKFESYLVRAYCESKAFSHARHLFDETPEWDVVSSTAIIGHFARRDRHEDAIQLFSRMLLLDIGPNEFTFSTVVPSSISLRDLNVGKQLHACATKIGLRSNVFVGSSVLDLYAKLGTVEEAMRALEDTHKPNVVSYTTMIRGYLKNGRFEDALGLFRKMPERNVVSWNAIIGGHGRIGHNEEAVNLFIEMLREGLTPDESTFPCVFIAAANIASLGMGKSFHAYAVKCLKKLDLFVGNSLISFYAKCGSMEDSLLVFSRLAERDIVSWNAVICGYAQNGRGIEALEFFQKMQVSSGIRPNSVTVLCLLLACNHAGLVEEGYSYFNMARNGDPDLLRPEHYACVVDLLSRSGRFQEAKRFLQELPFDPGIGFWKALLGGCQIHSNAELAELVAHRILVLDPGDVSSLVMLSNAHSAAGRWQNVSLIRKEMREKGMKRIPGCSWIEIRSKVHTFATRDSRHNERDEIYMVLRSCIKHLEDPNSDLPTES